MENSFSSKSGSIIFRDNYFDVIRLVAALQVFVIHGYEHLGLSGAENAIAFLQLFPGVPIFFFISGYLVSASYERSSDLHSYLKNRFLRIYPGLWACFLVSIMTVIIIYHLTAPLQDIFLWGAGQLTIAQFYNPDFLRGYGVGVLNGSLWTIPVELQFYLLLPLFYYTLCKANWNRYLFLSIVLCLIGLNQVNTHYKMMDNGIAVKLFSVTVIPYLYMFLLGVLLNRNIWFVERYLRGRAHFLLSIYLLTSYILYRLGFRIEGNDLNPISAILLGLLALSIAYAKKERNKDILRGNDISYGVYIYHMVIINIWVHLGKTGDWWVFIFALFITLILAIFSWRYIERPALRLKMRANSAKHGLQKTVAPIALDT